MNRYPKSFYRSYPLWKQCFPINGRYSCHSYGYCNHPHNVDARGLKSFVNQKSNYHPVAPLRNYDRCSLVTLNQSLSTIPHTVQQLLFHDYNPSNITSFNPSHSSFDQLMIIDIHPNCFKNVRVFILENMNTLEIVRIANNCFKTNDRECSDGLLRVSECSNLRQLEIGDHTFETYKNLTLSCLNSLQSIKFGKYSFYCIENFEIKGEWI